MEKKYYLPADKIEFMKDSIEKLKAENKDDHDAGEFDHYNWEYRGRYKAFEKVLQWLNEWAAAEPKPSFWDVAKAFKWASEYRDEIGGQLTLYNDQWTLISEDEDGNENETKDLTPGNVAELYCLQNGFDKEGTTPIYNQNEYPDLSSATPEVKAETINGLVELAAREVLKMFYAFGLKTHIECTIINDPTKEEFDFIFRKKAAPSGEGEVAFAEWASENGYSFDKTTGWMDEKYGVFTTAQLYELFKQNRNNAG